MIYEMPSCTGCRTCEMTCSFKRWGEFRPKSAAIQIYEKEVGLGYQIQLIAEDEKRGVFCSGCGECVEGCPAGNDLKQTISRFLKKRGKASS
jgi:anaerobic carbon-monoxide dehydrogenase iron sulfur subunit